MVQISVKDVNIVRKVEIELFKCKPGMKVAQTCFNNYGGSLVEEFTVLDQAMLDRLDMSGVRTLRVFEEDDDDDEHVVKIIEKYDKGIEEMKSVFQNLSDGKALEDIKIKQVVENIVTNIGENRDVVKCLNKIRDSDDQTYVHSVNVSMLCMLIGKWFKYSDGDLKNLVQAGLLHDIGKVKVNIKITHPRDSFTKEERNDYLKHVIFGYEIVANTEGIGDNIKSGVLYHHEKNDGTGYPRGLKGDSIPEFAKIIAIADLYDNMTTVPNSQERLSPFAVFDLFETKLTDIMDYKIFNIFMTNISMYYIGAKVMLNTGEIGEVIYMYPGHLSRPIVRVGVQFKDLMMQNEYKIVTMF